jgi:adenosine deaminase
MSVESYIYAMPKVDLHVQLEGAMHRDLIMMIAEQNDTARSYKKQKEYRDWVQLLKEPDFNRLDDIARETAKWVHHPEDIARAVYDLGVDYSKQNVRSAEISVIPVLYTDLDLTFVEFMEAINDGANRVERAWGVKMQWILAMPRDNPRKSDDISRWAISATGQKGNIVALSVVGREDAQPIAQFQKAFATVEKKELARIAPVYSYPDSDSFKGVMDTVHPTRISDAWGLIDDPEAIDYVVENDIPVVITPTREVRLGRINSVAEYPLCELLDKNVKVIIGSGMPALFETSINDEYLAAVEQAGLTLDEIETIALNSVRAAFLPDEEKQALLAEFENTYAQLREEHLAEKTE